jgi:hypothetical protein
LNVAEQYLLDADVLSYRNGPLPMSPPAWPSWLCGKAIAICGRNDDVHTGLVCKDNGTTVALGMRLARQKLKLLADEVEDNPGLIDVYRYVGYARWTGVHPHQAPPGITAETRRAIVNEVRRFALHDQYGWFNVLLTSGAFVPGLRWLTQPHFLEVDELRRPPHCSQAVSYAFRKHQVPLLKNRSDRQVLPGDLVTSPLLLYLFTLAPPATFPMPASWYFEKARQSEPQILPFPQSVPDWNVPGVAEPHS